MNRTLSVVAAAVLGIVGTAHAQGPLLLETEFSVFTSENAQGYTRPLFTAFQEGFASNLYHRAVYEPSWGIGLDISAMGMLIPEAHRTYDAKLPECYADQSRVKTAEMRDSRQVDGVFGSVVRPTIFGSTTSNPVFAVPQTEGAEDCGTVGFAEGNDIGAMPGIPNIQLLLRAPSRTEIRARFYPYSDGDRSLTYIGLVASQQLDPFIGLFNDSLMGLSASASYHSLTWTDIIEATGYSVGVHFSKSWRSGFGLYGGVQVEGLTGTFSAVRDSASAGETVRSPYDEVREGRPVAFDIESQNSFRALAGVSFRSGVVDLHVDAALAAQPVVSAGLAINVASF
jgi:hypothetical protein